MKPLDIYIRVSRLGDRDAEDLFSIEEQERMVRVYAAKHDIPLAAEPIVEVNRSGKNTKRPGLQRALERARTGQSGGIAVARLSRLSRSVADVDRIISGVARDDGTREPGLLEQGARFVAVFEGLNLDKKLDARDRVFLSMLSVFVQFELDNLTEQWEALHRRNVEQRGQHHSGVPPVGYEYVGEKANKRLVPDASASHIAEAFRRRAVGESLDSIAKFLEERGVVNRRARREKIASDPPKFGPWIQDVSWSGQAVAKILKNPVYLGQARGPYGTKKDDAHEALVTQEEWDAAQLPTRAWKRRDGHDNGALLKGLVVCAACGGKCSPHVDRYRCNRRPGPDHRAASMAFDILDRYVVAAIWYAADSMDVGLEAAIERKEAAKTAYNLARSRELAFLKRSENLDMDEDTYREAYLALKAEREAAHTVLLEAGQPEQVRAHDRLMAYAGDRSEYEVLPFWSDEFTLDEQRAHLRQFVDRVVITKGGRWDKLDDRIQIYWVGIDRPYDPRSTHHSRSFARARTTS